MPRNEGIGRETHEAKTRRGLCGRTIEQQDMK